jgi:hypothetical protein
MRGRRGFGWRARVALVMVFALIAAAGCAQRRDILREAGAKVVRLKIVWVSFPPEAGIAKVVAGELGSLQSQAGIAVMTSEAEFESQVKARFSWLEGFSETSQEVSASDMSSFDPVLLQGSDRVPASATVFDLSISSRTVLSVAAGSYPVTFILSDRVVPGGLEVGGRTYSDGKLMLGLGTRVTEDGVQMSFCPVVEVDGGRRERLQELAFSAKVGTGERLVLASAGVRGSFGEAAFVREKRRSGAAPDVPLPFSPPCSLRVSPGPKELFDQILIIMPLLYAED